ncbi:MAG: hypothetical protein K2V38_03925 [Gemmataceae bacterium]|nr:hypothetical protein [Gemmataceae bacterium]
MKWADHWLGPWVLGALALVLAGASARPFASSWNDGSRLASVESLVARGTFCIDGSPFLDPPPSLSEGDHPPYDPSNSLLRAGTRDKLLIDGWFYSDKPPLVSVPLAVAYRALMFVGAPAPHERPDVFAWVVCVLLSGLGYAVAVGCMWALGTRVGLAPRWRLVWLGAFALATVLPAYTRSANSHIAQLGAVALTCVFVCRIAEDRRAWASLFGAGFAAGFAYNLDFGVGPPFALAVTGIVALRTRSACAVAACGLGMAPCVVAGHAINFAIGHDWLKPLNMHPEYLAWPGSPFETTMTGVVRTRYVAQGLYALDLLVGKKGFLTHNLPLLLAVTAWLKKKSTPPAPPSLKGRGEIETSEPPGAGSIASGANSFSPLPEGKGGSGGVGRLELIALGLWCAASWLLYGVLSKNHGGGCVSVRWFVPFLVPGFWLLARVLHERPEFRRDFLALAGWGLVLAGSAWTAGPWWARNVPLYWWVFGGSLLTWLVVRLAAPRVRVEPAPAFLQPDPRRRRAA